MITVLDYGLGNVAAFVNIYKRLNLAVEVASTASQLINAKKIILPGVGAFDWAMTRLNESGMRECLDDLVLSKKVPVLGVCVGMQMMAKHSDEGKLLGLGWVDGTVKRFNADGFKQQTHLPHMGWNDVNPRDEFSLFENIQNPRFYFLHSYFFAATRDEDILGTTNYNGDFACAVNHANVFGTQFHPEKSHQWGVALLKNFAEL
jgi:imidazole glycerol-phosphate synthase subunit HisH